MHVIATGDPMRGRPSDLQAQQKPTKKNPNPEREQGISATAWAVESPDGLDPELAANSASVDVLYSVMRFVNLQLQLQCIEQRDGKSKLCSHGL